MSRTLQVIIGACIIGFGIVLYPYFVTYIWTPIVDILDTLFPTMGIWTTTAMDIVPLVVFILIFVIGGLLILGKVRGRGQDNYNE